jgi:uncharacterized protein YbaR (Trm112 family)
MDSWDALLKLVRCPIDHSPLVEADDALLKRLNDAIGRRQVSDRLGQTVEQPVHRALVNQDTRWLYRVTDGIPSLVADEAIQVETWSESSSRR